jgi:hypothetical protein
VAPRRTPTLLAAVAAALALAGPASAKELTRVAICGRADVCATISDPDRLRLVPMGGATSVAAPQVEPFYLLVLTVSDGSDSEQGGLYYLPESSLLAANGADAGTMVWLPIADARSRALMRDVVAGIEPHAAPPAWPRELKSTYRVVPDDAFALPESPAPRAGGEAGGGRAVRLAAPLVIALALAGLALLLRRLASHEPRHQRAEALAAEHPAHAFGDRQLDAPPV